MTTVDISESHDLSAMLDQVMEGERVILKESGKGRAALVSLDDLRMLEEAEDRLANDAAERALAESDERIAYDQVRRDLGLE
jgi:PHD/YefM family antitoxin component YafN of YafNO toxin-antitoxin module